MQVDSCEGEEEREMQIKSIQGAYYSDSESSGFDMKVSG